MKTCRTCSYNKKLRHNPQQCFKKVVYEGELTPCDDWYIRDSDRLELIQHVIKYWHDLESYNKHPESRLDSIEDILEGFLVVDKL